MSKYTITHTCGHTVVHNIVGKHTDRDSKAQWLESTDCPECYAKIKQEQREASDAAAIAASEACGELSGSEKQIAWAHKIRGKTLERAKKIFEGKEYDLCLQLFAAANSAKWWIDNKDAPITPTILNEIVVDFPAVDKIIEKESPEDLTEIRKKREEKHGKHYENQENSADSARFVVPAHAINELRYVPKCDKYIIALEFHGRAKEEFWISEKQAKALEKAFDGERYSTKVNQAFVILERKEGKLRFIWAAANEPNARKSAEYFGADWGWPEDKQ